MSQFPRVPLVHRPTPFRKLERLSSSLGGPSIFVKRDDLTGLAFGGNKSRKLEFIMADALAKKADTVMTWAGVQSNWCMQTAAAARMLGIRPVLVLFNRSREAPEQDGNLLLDAILEAEVHVIEASPTASVKSTEALSVIEGLAAEARSGGLAPYVIPVGGSLVMGSMERPLGAIAYVAAMAEISEQAAAAGIRLHAVVHATGSGSTQAGLAVGARALTDGCRIIGISVSDPRKPFSADVAAIASDTVRALDLPFELGPEDIEVDDTFIRDGYGIVNREVAEAIRLLFQREGLVLDPVYTAKAMAGLLAYIREGRFSRSDNVLFVHTGGTPALFPNRRPLLEHLAEPLSRR
jgi:L-cysteate sulfo-lyase